MNKANFNQTGGFPLETDTLDFMQNAYGVFNAVSDLSGHLTILKGCHTTGAQVSDGVVSINGEVLEFKGGSLGPNVMITEEITNKIFEDGVSKPVFTRRYVTFGTVAGSFPWADFKRPSSNIQLTDELAGRATQQALEALTLRLAKLEKVNTVFTAGGGMVLWNKPYNEIPEGWQEVTAWRKKLPMGYDPNTPNYGYAEHDGRETATLRIENIPPHSHSTTFTQGKAGGSNRRYLMAAPNDPEGTYTYQSGNAGGIGGTVQSFSILNPYRIVVFIEYIGG